MRDLVAFVLGGPRAGKTTAARILGNLLEAEAIETSGLIAASLERSRGLEPGSYVKARAADPELHRGELGRWGSEMARRNGWSAARIAVARGYRVISGTRRLTELRTAEREAVRRGLRPWPVYIARPSIVINDNTEEALRRHAESEGVVVANDGGLESLAAGLEQAVDIATRHQRHEGGSLLVLPPRVGS